MAKKLLLGGILGGIAVFIWGAISWMALPWHMTTLHKFKDEAAVVQVLKANAPKSGVYLLPNVHQHEPGTPPEQRKAAEEEGKKRLQEGPLAFTVFRAGGMEGMGAALIGSLVLNILSAVLITWLLLKSAIAGYANRVIFVVVVALIAALMVHLSYWNWWSFTTDYTLVSVADLLIGWALAGLAIAKVR